MEHRLPSWRSAFLAGILSLAALGYASVASAAGWVAQDTATTANLTAIDTYFSTHAMAAGGTTVTYTSDSGLTWDSTATGATNTIYDVEILDSNDAITVGASGDIWRTTDGGATWTELTSPTGYDINAAASYISTSGFTVTTYLWIATDKGHVYYSTDDGDSWTDVSISGAGHLADIYVAGSSTVYAVGVSGEAYKTTDRGSSWSTLNTSTSFDLATVDGYSSTIWVAGEADFLSKSTDSGATWTQIYFDERDLTDTIYELDFTSSTAGVMVTSEGGVWSTSDGGTNWSPATGGTSVTFQSIRSYSSTQGYAVGDSGTLYIYDATAPATPTGLSIGTSAVTSDTTPALSWTASTDAAGTIDTYDVRVDGAVTSDVGNVTSYTLSTLSLGSHTLSVRAVDEVGNKSSWASLAITVEEATTTSDTTAPTVGGVTPTSATEDTSTTFSVSYADAGTVSSCTLYINGSSAGSMSLSSGTASKSYTFSSTGTNSAYVKCTDSSGNIGTGSTTTITVAANSSSPSAEYGDLIKMACPGGEDVNHPCRAVYYYGADGKRHAFPNEKVFFTWYEDFDDVVTVTDSFMASIRLGYNVTYHPGTKMVKFISLNTVYVVDVDGTLRPVDSEATATLLYGSTWNRQIDDISDAFYSNYDFGASVTSSTGFDPEDVESAVDSIDDIL